MRERERTERPLTDGLLALDVIDRFEGREVTQSKAQAHTHREGRMEEKEEEERPYRSLRQVVMGPRHFMGVRMVASTTGSSMRMS